MTLNINSLPESKKYDLVKIRDMIENGFMHDWAIRIEYAAKKSENEIEWLSWDKSFFAIKDSTNVLSELIECCKSHPDCSMKLVCEHFRPEYRFVYCIHRKDHEAGKAQLLPTPVNA